jgi:hypothetical protein
VFNLGGLAVGAAESSIYVPSFEDSVAAVGIVDDQTGKVAVPAEFAMTVPLLEKGSPSSGIALSDGRAICTVEHVILIEPPLYDGAARQ